ncbi:MAG: hypothetical protein ACRDQA_05555 [Nocardioidaceae bacterium]
MKLLRIASSVAAFSVAALVSSAVPASAVQASAVQATPTPGSQTTPGVCANVRHCHVVGYPDVDGDHFDDQVGWRQINKQKVQIRVRTANGDMLTKRVNVRWWFGGGDWSGATHIDKRRGVEMLIGSEMGAHTLWYTMLTYRHGDLVVEKSPAAGAKWAADGAANIYQGWKRHVRTSGVVTMTERMATRTNNGNHFRGHNTTYVWRHDHWAKGRTVDTHYKNARQASKIGGWHVHGLRHFPGL